MGNKSGKAGDAFTPLTAPPHPSVPIHVSFDVAKVFSGKIVT